MKQPSLKEVKEYFKNAKIVVPVGEKTKVDITKEIQEGVHEWGGHFWIDLDSKVYKAISVLLWDKDSEKYAEILTYKEKTFSITESQVRELVELTGFESKTNNKLKELFPEVFKSEVKELPKDFTGWCKIHNMGNDDWLMYFEQGIQKHGIDSNKEWFVPSGIAKIKSYYSEATEQEVFESLKKEAIKRGYKEKDIITDIYYSGYCTLNNNIFEYNIKCLWLGDCVLFKDGKWAEITTTLSEAEQQLKKKIIV